VLSLARTTTLDIPLSCPSVNLIISFINILNNIGDKTLPYLTSQKVWNHSDFTPFMTILFSHLQQTFFTFLISLLETFDLCKISQIFCPFILSYGFSISTKVKHVSVSNFHLFSIICLTVKIKLITLELKLINIPVVHKNVAALNVPV
jgi:hypothetical protein